MAMVTERSLKMQAHDWIVSTPAKITEKILGRNELVSLTKILSEPGIDLT